MSIFTKFTKLVAIFVVAVLGSMIALTATSRAAALSIPYQGDQTEAAPSPAFDVFTGVPSVGDEHDFFRGQVGTSSATDPNTDQVNSTCATGTEFNLLVYVHDGASENANDNGNGPSVAHGTQVKVNLNNANASSTLSPSAMISASNASTVTDGMTIHCTDGKQVTLSFVENSATQFSSAGTQPLLDTPSQNITTTGVPIGTVKPDGNVWGCWTQRVYVTFKVKVTEVTPKPVPSNAICKINAGDVVTTDDRNVKVTLSPQLQNATVLAYEINWGDNTAVSTTQTATHQYAADGTYNIVAKVQVKLADGTTQWVSGGSCNQSVNFKANQPPTVITTSTPTPTTPAPTALVNTGAGNVVGIFGGVSIAGALLHKLYMARKAVRL